MRRKRPHPRQLDALLARLDLEAAPLPSPCISVCRIDAGLCAGCLRTREEIAAWGSLDERAKRAVWTAIRHRRDARRPAWRGMLSRLLRRLGLTSENG